MREWTPDGSAVLVPPEYRPGKRGVVEEVPGIGRLIAEKFECASVKGGASRFRNHVDHGPSGLIEDWRGERRRNPKLLDRIHRRLDDDRKCVAVRVVSAVQYVAIHVRTAAVHRRIQRDGAARALLHVVIDIVN